MGKPGLILKTYVSGRTCLATLLLLLVCARVVEAQPKTGEEWVDIPVIINVIGESDDSNVDEAIKKANEILKQAKIRLIVKKTNKPFELGDGDDTIVKKYEGSESQRKGKEELKNTFKKKDGTWNGKGMKINIANDVWFEQSGYTGWAHHESPVVNAEPRNDPNLMGHTIAHEISHALTLNYDLKDPNQEHRLMYQGGGGSTLEPNEIKEINEEAKKRGNTYTVQPKTLRKLSVISPGFDSRLHKYGAALDQFYDTTCVGTSCSAFNPTDPNFGYADLEEVTIFLDDPFAPNGDVQLRIELAGPIPPIPAAFFVNVNLTAIDPNQHLVPLGDILIQGNALDLLTWQARWQPVVGYPVLLPDPIVRRNDVFGGDASKPANHSINQKIPIEITSLSLASAQPILVEIDSNVVFPPTDPNLPDAQLLDDVDPFLMELEPICPIVISPRITFIRTDDTRPGFGIIGCGFDPNSIVQVELENDLGQAVIGHATVGADGTLVVPNIGSSSVDGVMMDVGENAVIVKDMDDSGPHGAAHAMGFFLYVPIPPIIGDLNGDGCVNLEDLIMMATYWLEGC